SRQVWNRSCHHGQSSGPGGRWAMNSTMNGSLRMLRSDGLPVIGICARTSPVKWLGFEMTATLIPQAYVDLLASAGCTPVLLPVLPRVEQIIDRLDGLL